MLFRKIYSGLSAGIKRDWLLAGFTSLTVNSVKKGSLSTLPLINVDSGNFNYIRSKHLVYVDKTKHIFENIVGAREGRYFFLARNRRTGKSLICSTIGEMFMGNKDLFKDLWISKDNVWNFEAETRPVIHLDMSQVVGKSKAVVVVKLRQVLMEMAGYAAIAHIDFTLPVQTILKLLIARLKEKSGKEVVVIIDEFDAPITELLECPDELKKVQDMLSYFYGVLKGMDSDLRLVYITGILKFSSRSLFSGLNNLRNLTFEVKAGSLVGYEENEIRNYFPMHLQALQGKLSLSNVDEVIHLLKKKYGGYSYGCNLTKGTLSNHVFNAFGVNNALAKLNVSNNAWYSSRDRGFLVQQIEKENALLSATEDTTLMFSVLDQVHDPTDISFELLMYYAGYATLKGCSKDGTVTIGTPNEDIMRLLTSDMFKKVTGKNHSLSLCQNIVKSLLACDEIGLKEHLQTLLAGIPYHLLKGKNEAVCHVSIHLAIKLGVIGHSVVDLMEDSTNIGRIDTVVRDPTTRTVYIIEVCINLFKVFPMLTNLFCSIITGSQKM